MDRKNKGQRYHCFQCEANFGQPKRLLKHLELFHGVEFTLEELFCRVFGISEKPLCACGCGSPKVWHSWANGYAAEYIRGHNPPGPPMNEQQADQHRQSLLNFYAQPGRSSWNKGLTKETDERIAKMSEKISETSKKQYESGERVAWTHGKTKETDERLGRVMAERQKKYDSGEWQPWNKGLTKETSASVAQAGRSISNNYASNRSAGRRVKQDELMERVAKFSQFELLNPEDYRRRDGQRLRFRCKQCDDVQLKSLAMIEDTPVCFSCNPKKSMGQQQLADFVRSLGHDVVEEDRSLISPREIDVLVPEAKLAIEYNGLYWHSERFLKDHSYHQKKVEKCLAKGYRLIGVYEDEWKVKRSVVESSIMYALKSSNFEDFHVTMFDQGAGARFFDSSHVLGSIERCSTIAALDPDNHVLAALAFEVFDASTVIRRFIGIRSIELFKSLLEHVPGRCIETNVHDRLDDRSIIESLGFQLKSVNELESFWTDFTFRAPEKQAVSYATKIWGYALTTWQLKR